MSNEIETTIDTIIEPTGTLFYASRSLLRKYNIEDTGANQHILSNWLTKNNHGKVDQFGCFLADAEIIIPKDMFNVLRIIGIRLFGANAYGDYYTNHAIVLNIFLKGNIPYLPDNQLYRDTLLSLINKYSYHQYGFYENLGAIYRTDKVNQNKVSSKTYSTILEKGVKDTDTQIWVYLVPDGVFLWTDNEMSEEPQIQRDIIRNDQKGGGGGGVTFSRSDDRSLILVAVTGKNGPSNFENTEWNIPPEYVLMHELAAHAIPQGLEGLDNLKSVSDIELKIAEELNLDFDRRRFEHDVRPKY